MRVPLFAERADKRKTQPAIQRQHTTHCIFIQLNCRNVIRNIQMFQINNIDVCALVVMGVSAPVENHFAKR